VSIEKERKAFDDWHLKQFKDINDDLNDDEAEHLYQRVYSHEAQDLIRQMEFNAWLSSANRQGYKLVPVDPTKEMLIAADGCVIDGKVTSNNIYKAMIGVINE
jgi:hypothetical protein